MHPSRELVEDCVKAIREITVFGDGFTMDWGQFKERHLKMIVEAIIPKITQGLHDENRQVALQFALNLPWPVNPDCEAVVRVARGFAAYLSE